MKTTLSAWRKTINYDIHEKINSIMAHLSIKADKLKKITEYVEFLMEQNENLNLVSRKLDVKTVIEEHIYDCLAPWEMFCDFRSITDLGTGAGLPGILLAILFDEKKTHLVEKSVKKTIFLKDVVKKLELRNVIIENRLVAETVINTEIITCRGFKSISEILDMTKKFYKNDGKYFLYKGRMEKIDEEINDAMKKYKFKYKIIKTAPEIEKERHMVEIHA